MTEEVDGTRQEFAELTKRQALRRSRGYCECGCGQELGPDREYDHILPCFYGGDNSLANCQVLTPACHRRKSRHEKGPMAKSRRLIKKRLGKPTKKRRYTWPSRKLRSRNDLRRSRQEV